MICRIFYAGALKSEQKKDRLKNLSLKNISCNFLLYIDYFLNLRSMLLDGVFNAQFKG